MKPYRIAEYDSFMAEKKIDGYHTLPQKTFDQLEAFLLENRNRDTDALELMGLSARKGVGKTITAKNYVGVLTMKDGTSIEILPKVYSAIPDDTSGTKAKKLLIDMLKTLRESPYKSLQTGSVNVEKMNIFEVFIRMFVDEVFFIVKRGLKCSYETVEENTTFFKGKMKFSQQLRLNCFHKERSFVEYDAFNVNRPENRLIKAALLYLYPRSTSSRNKKDIKTLLNSFADVEPSADYRSDFSGYVPDRNMKDYSNALLWSRIFLMGKSFTSFAGSEVSMALLFPMETLFESYIAALLKKRLDSTVFSVSVQDKRYHLFDEPGKQFPLCPDIVVTRKSDNSIFILDTKWKILAEDKTGYGISQADMYQMFAYQKKYGAAHVTLVYPKTDKIASADGTEYRSTDGVIVRVCFVDLFDAHGSIETIISQF